MVFLFFLGGLFAREVPADGVEVAQHGLGAPAEVAASRLVAVLPPLILEVSAVNLRGEAPLVVAPRATQAAAELVKIVVVVIVRPVRHHEGVVEQRALSLEFRLHGGLLVVVSILLARHAHAHADERGPAHRQFPGHFTADGREPVLAQEEAVGEILVREDPGVVVNAVLEAEPVEILAAAQFETEGQVLDLAEPLLELVFPDFFVAIVEQKEGAEAFNVVARAQGSAELEALHGPAVALRVVVG